MADTAVHIGENSPEQVAFKLFEVVARLERKSLTGTDASELKSGWDKADREYVLQTYRECISIVRNS